MKETIQKFSQSFFEKLWVNIISLQVTETEKNKFLISLKSDDWTILLWNNGNSIDALQRIVTMCIRTKSTHKTKVQLEINDYLKSKDERLYSFIDEKVKILLENGWEYMLPQYSPYERKKIHSYIAYINKWINTKSRWEWKERRLFLLIAQKNNSKITPTSKLTIDIDWDNI